MTRTIAHDQRTGSDARIEPDVYAAAGLSLAAALIHLWALGDNLDEWWGYGAFFLATALAQGLFSVLILRWPEGQSIPLAGILGNLSIVVLYVVSRTWGMPVGPGIGHQDDAEVLGMSATAVEVGLIILLVTRLREPYRKITINVLLFAGAMIWALRFVGVLP